MKPKEDLRELIYNQDRKIDNLINRLKNNKAISETNKQLLLDFREKSRSKHLSKCRIEIQLQSLYRIAPYAPDDLKKATQKDVEKIMAEILDKHYSPWTIETIKAVLKSFFRWMRDVPKTDPAPIEVRWIERCTPPNKLSKEDLITEEDLTKMINSTPNTMHKGAMSSLHEGAIRPGSEFLGMRIKDVSFFEDYAVIRVRGKMEKKNGDREVYLVRSHDLLRAWVDNHPFKNDPEHPLWIVTTDMKKRIRPEEHKGICWNCGRQNDLEKLLHPEQQVSSNGRTDPLCSRCEANLNLEKLYGKVISLKYLNKILKEAAKKAGIKKRIYGYLFRHSGATILYGTIGEALAKRVMGHSADTRCARVYNHLNNDDLLDGVKRANGLPEDEKKIEPTGVCPKCSHPNGYGAATCSRCGMCLSLEAAIEVKIKEEDELEYKARSKKLLDFVENNPRLLKTLGEELEKAQAAGNTADSKEPPSITQVCGKDKIGNAV
ncbi:site-specific integrase [archaeon]|nr:site-specific integrase [Nanoarchaeota archaeon]MBU4451176.1 site-specific integrase [Nanoarchaeota archaeon]MCG2724319.1 site-specific integrase [archaeon]